MIILGIDPGTATTGFAFIEKESASKMKVLEFGVMSTDKKKTDSERLFELGDDLEQLIKKYKPTLAGVEKLYFENNQKTAITVAQARGVALLMLHKHHAQLLEFTPLQVKNIACGYGKADKKQVQTAMKSFFRMPSLPKPDDAADALAIAFAAAIAHRRT
jgi:crossover junction endodeoxyribonuclease RuvC